MKKCPIISFDNLGIKLYILISDNSKSLTQEINMYFKKLLYSTLMAIALTPSTAYAMEPEKKALEPSIDCSEKVVSKCDDHVQEPVLWIDALEKERPDFAKYAQQLIENNKALKKFLYATQEDAEKMVNQYEDTIKLINQFYELDSFGMKPDPKEQLWIDYIKSCNPLYANFIINLITHHPHLISLLQITKSQGEQMLSIIEIILNKADIISD